VTRDLTVTVICQ